MYLRQSETDIVSVSTDVDGLAGQSKLVTTYDASACGCSGEQWSDGRYSLVCLRLAGLSVASRHNAWVSNGITA